MWGEEENQYFRQCIFFYFLGMVAFFLTKIKLYTNNTKSGKLVYIPCQEKEQNPSHPIHSVQRPESILRYLLFKLMTITDLSHVILAKCNCT